MSLIVDSKENNMTIRNGKVPAFWWVQIEGLILSTEYPLTKGCFYYILCNSTVFY